MNNKIGYARVSTIAQKLDSQIDALEKAGCIKIFSEKSSGVKDERVGWKKLMEYIRPGDILVVTELSRMTRSLMHLLKVVKELEEQNISILSLRENIDTTTATGRCFISMIGAISQMERELKAERTAAGRAAAKARGRTGGRPKIDPEKIEQASILYQNSDKSAAEVCKMVGIGKRTLFKYLAERKNGDSNPHG